METITECGSTSVVDQWQTYVWRRQPRAGARARAWRRYYKRPPGKWVEVRARSSRFVVRHVNAAPRSERPRGRLVFGRRIGAQFFPYVIEFCPRGESFADCVKRLQAEGYVVDTSKRQAWRGIIRVAK